jgi:hypothetical protein
MYRNGGGKAIARFEQLFRMNGGTEVPARQADEGRNSPMKMAKGPVDLIKKNGPSKRFLLKNQGGNRRRVA